MDDSLTLMYRPDALVREILSGDIYVISWKTCATFTKRTIDQAKTDMQSISEVWGKLNDLNHDSSDVPAPKTIEGVLYRFAVKGRRTLDDWDGLYKQQSHLIYGWMKLGASPEETEWSWQYAWTDPDEINPKTGKPVGHKLGKGWKKVPIWREYPGGVKTWIEALSNHQINPRHVDALEAVFPQPLPVERRKDEVESWKRQIVEQEHDVQARLNSVERLSAMGEAYGKVALDRWFPQHTGSCFSYSGCPFHDVCWGGVEPIDGDLYQIRDQNHPEKEESND